MKQLEYIYNIIYYFFYKGFIKAGIFFAIYNPLIILIYLYYKVPSVKQKWLDKGIENPYKHHIDIRIEKFIKNPKFGLATMYGGGMTIVSLAGFYVGFYKIANNLFFPDVEISFKYIMLGFALFAFITDMFLNQMNDQGEKYIIKFNKIKDKRWRLKWSIITALTFPLSITFMVLTSKNSYIGGFFFQLHGYIFG